MSSTPAETRVIAQIHRSLEQGQFAAAEQHCRQHLAQQPGSMTVRELLALTLAQQRRLPEARALLQALVAEAPGVFQYQVNLGCVCLDQDDLAGALAAFKRAQALEPDNAGVLLNLGLAHYRAGEFPAAAPQFEAALFADPALTQASIYLARCHLEQDQPAEALRALEPVRSAQGLDAAALNELGLVWLGLDQDDRARAAFEFALRFDPTFDEALTNLAALAERHNRLTEAQACLDRQSAAGQAQPSTLLVRARLLGRAGQAEQALQLLDQLASPHDARMASEIAFERGQMLDRLERIDSAFTAFTQANELARRHQARLTPAAASDGILPWLQDHPELDAAVLSATTPAPKTPVFLVGFPRSGTTLLDQALDAHPAFSVLEEKPAVEEMARLLRQRSAGYPGSLATLQAADIDRLRAAYWGVVQRHLQLGEGVTLVDKYPLNMAHLPLILRVFPGARFIFSVRHPCAVVLSCFMQNFRFTDTTQGFWTLDGSARLYAQIMSLWLEQRGRLNPACLDLRYEDLVQDFEGQLRRVLGFLDAPWNEAVLRYAEHAGTRSIRTPSYGQVVQPVYQHARERWLKYRAHFGAARTVLQPYVARLGYLDSP